MPAPKRPNITKPKLKGHGLTPEQLLALAERASYIGSAEHKDIPSMGVPARPRPDASLCPHKWVRETSTDRATALLRQGIRSGMVSDDAALEQLPTTVWVRDPDAPQTVYQARRTTEHGYKAWPLSDQDCASLRRRGVDV